MIKLMVVALSMMAAGSAFADPATCVKTATDKKLAGAALTSFMTKCESDAKLACEKASADKKVAGAEKSSFEKKCLEDASGVKTAEKKKVA